MAGSIPSPPWHYWPVADPRLIVERRLALRIKRVSRSHPHSHIDQPWTLVKPGAQAHDTKKLRLVPGSCRVLFLVLCW